MPSDHDTVIDDLKAEVRASCEARDWNHFHGARDLADILIFVLGFGQRFDFDLAQAGMTVGPFPAAPRGPTRALAGKAPLSLVWIPLLLLLWGPTPVDAQRLRHRVGLAPRIGLLIGAGDLLDGGFGIEGTGGIRLGDSPVWIRGDAGFLGLDAITPTPGGPTSVNTLLTLVVGPEVEGRLGNVRPFLHVLAGYVLNVPSGDVSTADTNGSGTLGGGAGVRLRLSSAARPPLIEAAMRLTHSGELSFARVEDSVDTDVTTFELRLGLLVGLP